MATKWTPSPPLPSRSRAWPLTSSCWRPPDRAKLTPATGRVTLRTRTGCRKTLLLRPRDWLWCVSTDPTLPVDVLADVFPLIVAVVVTQVPIVASHHLPTVFSRLVIGLGQHPETEIKGHQSLCCIHVHVNKRLFFFFNTALGSGSHTTNIECGWCRRSTPRRPPSLGHSGRSRKPLHPFCVVTHSWKKKRSI